MKKFTYYFNLFDFDANGAVCASEVCDKQKACSNFLYMVAKYNQQLLGKNELPLFFKQDLSALLQSVENGGDFLKARAEVVSHCLPQIVAASTKSDCDFLMMLADMAKVNDQQFAEKFRTARNNLELSYLITQISGRVFEKIQKTIDEKYSDQKDVEEAKLPLKENQMNGGDADIHKGIILLDEKAVIKQKSELFKNIIKYNALIDVAQKIKDEEKVNFDGLFA